MAKAYEPPKNTRDEEARKAAEDKQMQQQHEKQQGEEDKRQEQEVSAQQKIEEEQRQQSEKSAKERQAYLDELNRRIEEVVTFAGKQKDQNPQMLNLTSEALKHAADQIDAATPQGITRHQQPQSGNPAPSMRQ